MITCTKLSAASILPPPRAPAQVTVPPSNGVVTLSVSGTLDFTSYCTFAVTVSNTAGSPVSLDDIQLTYAMNATTNRVRRCGDPAKGSDAFFQDESRPPLPRPAVRSRHGAGRLDVCGRVVEVEQHDGDEQAVDGARRCVERVGFVPRRAPASSSQCASPPLAEAGLLVNLNGDGCVCGGSGGGARARPPRSNGTSSLFCAARRGRAPCSALTTQSCPSFRTPGGV